MASVASDDVWVADDDGDDDDRCLLSLGSVVHSENGDHAYRIEDVVGEGRLERKSVDMY